MLEASLKPSGVTVSSCENKLIEKSNVKVNSDFFIVLNFLKFELKYKNTKKYYNVYILLYRPNINHMNEIVPIRMSTEDKAKLQEKAKQNRLKLSSYLRYELTKNLSNE